MISGCVEELREILLSEAGLLSVFLRNITNLLKIHSEILSTRPSATRIWLFLEQEIIEFLLILSSSI